MMSETVKDTCDSFGYVTPCGDSSHSDSDCVITVENMYALQHIQQTLCPDSSTWTCSPLNEVCMYMGGGWNGGSSLCNSDNSTRAGREYSNKHSLCALEVQI